MSLSYLNTYNVVRVCVWPLSNGRSGVFFFVGDENLPLATSQIQAKHSAEDGSAEALNHEAKRTLIEI